jgi:hypothetical protein
MKYWILTSILILRAMNRLHQVMLIPDICLLPYILQTFKKVFMSGICPRAGPMPIIIPVYKTGSFDTKNGSEIWEIINMNGIENLHRHA